MFLEEVLMEKRRRAILEEVEEYGKVRVAELSKKLNCSEVTIRSDIKVMARQGLVQRIHGGAVKLDSGEYYKYSAESLYRNVEQKRAIAVCAYECIEPHDTIIIDDASGSFYLAEEIKSNPGKRIAVVTNSLLVGNELAGVKHVELYMVGGPVGGHLAATMGDETVDTISGFRVDKAFIGVHSINFEAGLTSIATPQMQVKKAILKVASKVYVLADSSKFGAGYLSVICPLNEVYRIITDNQVKQEILQRAEKDGVPLVVAG